MLTTSLPAPAADPATVTRCLVGRLVRIHRYTVRGTATTFDQGRYVGVRSAVCALLAIAPDDVDALVLDEYRAQGGGLA